MELKTLTCPSCGASLQIPEGKDRFFCTFCGSQIQVDDGRITIDINANVNVNQRYTDVARMRELDLQEKEQERLEDENRRNRRRKFYWVLALLISILIYVLCMVVCASFYNALRSVFRKIASIIAFLSPIVLLITCPKEWRASIKISERSGCSRLIALCIVFSVILSVWALIIIIPYAIGE